MKHLFEDSVPFRGAFIIVLGMLYILIVSTPVLAGEPDQQRFAKTLLLLRDAANGEVVGRIMPGTALRVLAEDGANIKVEVTGWSPVGGERYLFKEMGQRIRQAKLTESAVSKRTVVAEKEDYYENVWQDVSVTGWIESAGTGIDLDAIWKEASDLFHMRCTRCHALHRPTEFTANQWPSILKIMTVRAGLSDDRKALVTRYLQIHAKGREGAEAFESSATQLAQKNWQAPLIKGDAKLAAAGAALFQSRGCFACHGANARTPILPYYPILTGQSADYLFKQMKQFQGGVRANDQFHMMKEALAKVPEAEMRAIAYWLSTQ